MCSVWFDLWSEWLISLVEAGCDNIKLIVIVSPVRSTYGGYYGLVVVTPPRPHPQTLHRSHDNLKNPYRIASIFYM